MNKTTVIRKELPTAALWAGAIISPILCITSILELFIEGSKMAAPSMAWTVFIIAFTAFYSYDFAKQLGARLKETDQSKLSKQPKQAEKNKKAK